MILIQIHKNIINPPISVCLRETFIILFNTRLLFDKIASVSYNLARLRSIVFLCYPRLNNISCPTS